MPPGLLSTRSNTVTSLEGSPPRQSSALGPGCASFDEVAQAKRKQSRCATRRSVGELNVESGEARVLRGSTAISSTSARVRTPGGEALRSSSSRAAAIDGCTATRRRGSGGEGPPPQGADLPPERSPMPRFPTTSNDWSLPHPRLHRRRERPV